MLLGLFFPSSSSSSSSSFFFFFFFFFDYQAFFQLCFFLHCSAKPGSIKYIL